MIQLSGTPDPLPGGGHIPSEVPPLPPIDPNPDQGPTGPRDPYPGTRPDIGEPKQPGFEPDRLPGDPGNNPLPHFRAG